MDMENKIKKTLTKYIDILIDYLPVLFGVYCVYVFFMVVCALGD